MGCYVVFICKHLQTFRPMLLPSPPMSSSTRGVDC